MIKNKTVLGDVINCLLEHNMTNVEGHATNTILKKNQFLSDRPKPMITKIGFHKHWSISNVRLQLGPYYKYLYTKQFKIQSHVHVRFPVHILFIYSILAQVKQHACIPSFSTFSTISYPNTVALFKHENHIYNTYNNLVNRISNNQIRRVSNSYYFTVGWSTFSEMLPTHRISNNQIRRVSNSYYSLLYGRQINLFWDASNSNGNTSVQLLFFISSVYMMWTDYKYAC